MKGGPGAYQRAGAWDDFELAKDVAAFANAAGGTIVVGLVEDTQSGVVRKVRSVTSAEAADLEKALRSAVSRRCRPSPLYDVDRPAHEGATLFVVEVAPAFGSLIGVLVASDATKASYAGDAYAFPVRSGTGTLYLAPERFPVMIDAKVRRAAQMFLQIKAGDIVEHVNLEQNRGRFTLTFHAVDEGANAVLFDQGESARVRFIGVPLDGINHIWLEQGNLKFSADGVLMQRILHRD